MKIPKGKGFELNQNVVITVVTNEELVFTGRFLGGVQDRNCHKHCVDLDVTVPLDPEFILLQLTCEVDEKHIPRLRVGAIVAISVSEIIFIAPIASCCND